MKQKLYTTSIYYIEPNILLKPRTNSNKWLHAKTSVFNRIFVHIDMRIMQKTVTLRRTL